MFRPKPFYFKDGVEPPYPAPYWQTEAENTRPYWQARKDHSATPWYQHVPNYGEVAPARKPATCI